MHNARRIAFDERFTWLLNVLRRCPSTSFTFSLDALMNSTSLQV